MRKSIKTDKAPKAIGPYSQAIETDGYLFLSGQLAIDPAKGAMIDGGIVEQTAQVMTNIGSILKEAGLDYGNIVKTTIFLSDMGNFQKMNEVYGRYFPDSPPARSCFEVSKLPLNALIEIEVIAVKAK